MSANKENTRKTVLMKAMMFSILFMVCQVKQALDEGGRQEAAVREFSVEKMYGQ